MKKRKDSVQTLLKRCESAIQKIEELYNDSLHNQEVNPELQVDIKNFLENLRSVLDYTAHDIRESHCPTANPKARFYFPILPGKKKFEAQTRKWFPDLETNAPDLWKYLESIQPYHDSSRWLGQFNSVNNENKHVDLVAQTKTKTEQLHVSSPSGKVVWNPENVKFGSGVKIGGVPVNPRTQLPVPHPSQKVERIIWVDFLFKGEDISALCLVKEAFKGVKNIVDKVDHWL